MTENRARRSVLDPPSRRDWLVLGGFTALFVLAYLLGTAASLVTTGEVRVHPTVSRPVLYPGLFVLAPPVVAALNRFRGGTVVGTVAVGLVPGLAFVLLAGLEAVVGTGSAGDSPLWALSMVFSGIGVLGALAGLAVAHLVAVGTRRLG